MKLKEGFILKKMGDQYVAVAVGELSRSFHGMVRLNQTGAFLWEQLAAPREEAELVKALAEHYNIDKALAEQAVGAFLESVREAGLLA